MKQFIKEFKEFISRGNVMDLALYYGKFITAVINFLIMALVIFVIVKVMNTAAAKFVSKEEDGEEEDDMKICPFCKSQIAADAVRCPHCTSVLDESGDYYKIL